MMIKSFKFYRWISLILTISLLIGGCGVSGKNTPSTTPSGDAYEQFDKSAILAQKEFDELCLKVFRDLVTSSTISLHYSLMTPSAYGITDAPITFGEFSLEELQKSTNDCKQLKSELSTINYQHLTSEQQTTYDVLTAYLDGEITFDGLEIYHEPLSPLMGVQAQLPILLSEYIFYEKQDIVDYLVLLEQIDEYFGQILAFEQQKANANVFMSLASLNHVIESCQAYMTKPEDSLMNSTFELRVRETSGLSEEEKSAFIAQNLQIVSEHFIPAYEQLIAGLTQLKPAAKENVTLTHYPKGKAYYEYLIRSNIAPSYGSVEDLKKAIEHQMNRDFRSMSRLIKDTPDLGDHLESFSLNITDPYEILGDLEHKILETYPTPPVSEYKVKPVAKPLEPHLSPAFYLVPAIDNYKSNVIYLNNGREIDNMELYTTLAHEGYPGHLYQNIYFMDQQKHPLRYQLNFESYSEGWATYVEHQSFQLMEGIDPELAQLLSSNSFNTLGLHAILDIYINYDGWDLEKVKSYLNEYYGIAEGEVATDIFNAICENPTSYLKYYVGAMEILNMRLIGEKKLGERFDEKAFHQFILDFGPASFSVIRPAFDEWIKGQS